MAKIHEEVVVIKLSKLIKDKDGDDLIYATTVQVIVTDGDFHRLRLPRVG